MMGTGRKWFYEQFAKSRMTHTVGELALAVEHLSSSERANHNLVQVKSIIAVTSVHVF